MILSAFSLFYSISSYFNISPSTMSLSHFLLSLSLPFFPAFVLCVHLVRIRLFLSSNSWFFAPFCLSYSSSSTPSLSHLPHLQPRFLHPEHTVQWKVLYIPRTRALYIEECLIPFPWWGGSKVMPTHIPNLLTLVEPRWTFAGFFAEKQDRQTKIWKEKGEYTWRASRSTKKGSSICTEQLAITSWRSGRV